jgi:predicted SAM-dependent methyltransferase
MARAKTKEALKINLGCGNLWKDDWCNLDGGPATKLMWCRGVPLLSRCLPATTRRYPPDLIVHNLRRVPLPFGDDSAAVIFTGYAFEYISVNEARALLKDCWRILRPGGLMRMCQTDIAMVVQAYVDGSHGGACQSAIDNAEQFLGLVAPGHRQWSMRIFRGGGVQQLFDKAKIEFMLAEAGFREIRFYRRDEGQCPDLEFLERPERCVAPLLHVEARKPGTAG